MPPEHLRFWWWPPWMFRIISSWGDSELLFLPIASQLVFFWVSACPKKMKPTNTVISKTAQQLSILNHCDWYICLWIFLSACDSVLVQWKNGKAKWTERHSGGKWHSAKIWVIICLSILFTTICTWIILQILKASEFFMLDSLKRRCECLAADYLDCDNVLDTYTFAKVKVAFVYMTLCLLDKFSILFGYSNFSCARQKNSFLFVKPSCLGISQAWWRSWISGMHWLITTKEMWVLSHDGLI